MTTFNRSQTLVQSLTNRGDATTNHEGGLAFVMDAMTRLYTRACTALVRQDKFYVSAEQADKELIADIHAVGSVAPEFVLRLAAYVRQVMNLRTVSLVMLAEAASIPACKPLVRRWTPQILRRVDELTEVVAYWKLRHGDIGARGQKGGANAFPNSLSNGIADAFGQFDEYQFAKYDRKGSVTLRDVLRIVRPKPISAEQSAMFRYLVKGEVDVTYLPMTAAKAQLLCKTELDAEARVLAQAAHATWEVMLSHFGRMAEVWNSVHLPFMAGMRNLGNLLEVGADKALDRVVAMLRNQEQVRRSKQLPHRFFSAYKAVEARGGNSPRQAEVMEAVLVALEASVANVPRMQGVSFITMDNSGSMRMPLSKKSAVQYVDVANLLGAMGHTMCEQAICSVFGDGHAVVPVVRQDSILTNMRRFANTNVGYSTNAHLSIRHLNETRTRVDRIILLSDMECYATAQWGEASLAREWRQYRSSVNPDAYLYSIDLSGNGTSQFPADEKRVACLAGWSEKLLEFIPAFEQGGTKAVERIAAWSPFAEAAPEVSHETDDGAEDA